MRPEIGIKAAHERARQTYGSGRLQAEPADHDIHAGVHRIKRIRRKPGSRRKQKRKSGATTNPDHALPETARATRHGGLDEP